MVISATVLLKMCSVKVAILFLITVYYSSVVDGSRILCIYTTVSRSHFIPTEALLFGLAERGHDVTVVTQFPSDKQHKNYRHIAMERNTRYDEIMEIVTREPGNKLAIVKTMPKLLTAFAEARETYMQSAQLKRLMDEETFDLVIFEVIDEPLFGLGAHFNCPIILFSSVKGTSRVFDLVGNPYEISYIPHLMARYNGPLGFKERVLTFIWYGVDKIFSYFLKRSNVEQYNKYFPGPKYPSFAEMGKNISAVFLSHHFSQGDVRPNVPAIIEVGGIQMKDTASPLPDDLQKWMDASINGVIFFSLGSNIKTKNIPKSMLEGIVATFAKLQLNVLWKSETNDIPGLSSNVKTVEWVSQTDVLQHKNLKLFVTHGGFGSMTECKYYGVPALVIPMFADQMTNSEQVEYEGWGIKLNFLDVNEETLTNSIAEVLNNPKYRTRVQYEKILYRDRPLSALETGIYWTEYVIRHHGAKHMQSNAIYLNYLQLHSLDVIGLFVLIGMIGTYINIKILKSICRRLCKRLTKSKRD